MGLDIIKLAGISKIRLSKQETEKYQSDIGWIVEKLKDGLPDVEYIEQPPSAENQMQLRKDEIKPSLKREVMLENAPVVEAGCIVVPKLMEQ